MKRAALIDVIEASYRVEQEESAWLTGVLAAAQPHLDHGLGCWAMSYDLDGADDVRFRVPVALGLPPGGTLEDILAMQSSIPRAAVAQTFQTTTCGTASQLLGAQYEEQTGISTVKDMGVGDTLGINVRDPTSTGCLLVGILPKRSALTPREIAVWKKIAAHIAAGFRLVRARATAQHTAPAESAEAVLTPTGRVEHATPEAQSAEARAQLRAAVLAIEAARGKMRRDAPESAVAQWKGLVAARWTLVDQVEVGGKRYVLARDNTPAPESPAAELTTREQQVLGFAALGHHNKLIAYEMGIADATVRVLLARAAAKLGTAGRDETIRAFIAISRASRGGGGGGDGDGTGGTAD